MASLGNREYEVYFGKANPGLKSLSVVVVITMFLIETKFF